MSQVSVRAVSFVDVIGDLRHLLLRNHEETSPFPGIPLDIDAHRYMRIEAMGALRCYVATVSGRMIGYAAFIVDEHLHHKGAVFATQDVIYVEPESRKTLAGMLLVRFIEDDLRDRGVQVIIHFQKKNHPALGKMLARMGYKDDEVAWMKRLDVSDRKINIASGG